MPAPRKCVVDATLYEYCPRCGSKDNATETWRVNFCSENCRDIYKTVNAYTHKKITVGQAKTELERLDTVKLPAYADAFKIAIVEIMADSTPAPIVETPVVEETPVVDTIEEVAEIENDVIETSEEISEVEEVSSEQPTFKRKKRK